MSKKVFLAAARESEATYGEVTPRMKMRDASPQKHGIVMDLPPTGGVI